MKDSQSLDVLIINSPLFRDKVDGYDEDSLPPLGLGYIATDLLSNGMTVELLDAVEANIPLDIILTIVRQKSPRYVALNVFTTNLHLVREILDRSFFVNQPLRYPSGFSEISIITSRGCVYNCAFCSAARSLNREIPIRERNSQGVANELLEMCNLYPGLNSARILDDLFLRNAESVERAARMFKNIPLTWRAMAHVLSFYKLSDAHLLQLKRSGCDEVFVGIESGSSRILKMIHKVSDVKLIKQTIGRLFCAGINVKGYFIFGFETETAEDMQMSYDLAILLKEMSVKNGANFRTSVFQFRPYHGTELYYDLVLKGKIIDKVEHNENLSANIGRRQFNFTSGNFSEASDDILRKFVVETNRINQ